jgi:hypothetical protein
VRANHCRDWAAWLKPNQSQRLFDSQPRRAATATFRGDYAAVLNEDSLDVNVLGRDILGFFATIVDYPNRLVCLVAQSHDYQIVAR